MIFMYNKDLRQCFLCTTKICNNDFYVQQRFVTMFFMYNKRFVTMFFMYNKRFVIMLLCTTKGL